MNCRRMLVCVLFSLLFSQILFSKQIRVGYFLYSGFQNLEDGEFSGYGYEYLREIQKYNDWQYEFVTEIPEKDSSGNKTGRMIPLSYDRALTMLEKGELDIVGSVRKSPDRERHFLFSRFGAGIAYEMLTADAQKNNINKNMQARIGIRTGSIREREFSQICEAAGYNNITFCYFEYNEDMERALHETGEIDFILSSSLRKTNQEQLVYKYNPASHYFICNIDRPDLMEDFNKAQAELLLQKTEFTQELYAKYYKGTKNSTLLISQEEREYIAANPVLQVVHDSSWFPIDYTDAQGNPKGIVPDIFRLLEQSTGFTFSYISGENYKETLNLFKNSQNAMLAIFGNDYAWAERKNVLMSSSYINLPMSAVSYRRIDNIKEPSLVVAGVEGYFFTHRYLSSYDNVLLVENVEACMEAVRTKKADITFVASYSAERLLQKPKYGKLIFYTLADMNYDVCIGFHTDVDSLQYQILHRAVNNLSQVEINQCIYDNTLYYMEPENILYFAEKYGEGIIAALILLTGIAVFTVYLFLLNARRKKSNETLALANSELHKAFRYAEQANRSKTDFLSRVSHDIRTPMNIITGMTDIALENIKNTELVKKSLEKILSASDFLLQLINDVLDMSKIENGKMIIKRDYFHLSHIIDHLMDFFDHRMRAKGLEFTINVSGIEHDYVCGDAVHIEQILLNLLGNALKYTNSGSVQLIITEHKREATFSLFTFTVRDTGIGITKDFINNIWEPFEKEKQDNSSSSTSFGLGLAIVKSLVNLMDGSIEVESTPGQGSAFTVTLPLQIQKEDSFSELLPDNAEKSSYEFHNELILVVEDNEINMEIAQVMMHAKNLRTEAVYNGEDAVKKFKDSPPGYYHAILMDIRMPGIDGREATRLIRSLNREDAKTIPIIALSADAFAEEIKISQSAGMNEYITKPIRKQELYRVLDTWINGKDL